MDETRTFGVEIEIGDVTSVPRGADVMGLITSSMAWAGMPTILAPDGSEDEPVGGSWKVVHDPTAGPDGKGGPELVSPPLAGQRGLMEVARVCELLKQMGATVNDHCGLHVHHAVGDLTISQMLRVTGIYRAHQEAISSLLPTSRRNNEYAMPEMEPVHDADALQHLPPAAADHHAFLRLRVSRALGGGSRDRAVNWMSYACHGTVEFRQHHGTVDAREIIYWVLFTHAIVSAAASGRDLNDTETPARWLHHMDGSEQSCRDAMMWADLSRPVAADPFYPGLRRHYRKWRLLAA